MARSGWEQEIMPELMFTPPLTVPVKVAEISIVHFDRRWHLTIDGPDGQACWQTVVDGRPGCLLNKALQWANDRGLNVYFVNADITKQVPRQEPDAPDQTLSQ